MGYLSICRWQELTTPSGRIPYSNLAVDLIINAKEATARPQQHDLFRLERVLNLHQVTQATQTDTVETRGIHGDEVEERLPEETVVYQATPLFGHAPEGDQRFLRESVQYLGDQIVRKARHFPEYFRISPPYSSRRAVTATLWRISLQLETNCDKEEDDEKTLLFWSIDSHDPEGTGSI